MLTSPYRNQAWIASIQQGKKLVVSSAALVRRLRQDYINYHLEQGIESWKSPVILEWHSWLSDFVHRLMVSDLIPSQRILTDRESRLLWHQCFIACSQDTDNMIPSQGSHNCFVAWKLFQEWEVHSAIPDLTIVQHPLLLDMIALYQQICLNRHLTDVYQALRLSIHSQDLDCFLQRENITVYGIDKITATPLQQYWISRIADATRTNVWLHIAPQENKSLSHLIFKDQQTEIMAAAFWAKDCILSGKAKTVGLVIDFSEAQRNDLDNLLTEVLDPISFFSAVDGQKTYSLTWGQKLIEYPIIKAAALILSLELHDVSSYDFVTLLRSPFINGATTEWHQRVHFEKIVTHLPQAVFSWGTILDHKDCPPILRSICKGWLFIMSTLDEHQHIVTKHLDTIHTLLTAFGWPGENRDSHTEQAYRRFHVLLESIGCCEAVLEPISYHSVVDQVLIEIKELDFQPETSDTPIQVLHSYDAAAMGFDAIWIAGMNSNVCPESVNLNTCLTRQWQEKKCIPTASVQDRFKHATHKYQTIIESTTSVIMSCARQHRDIPLAPSTLWRILPERNGLSLHDIQKLFQPSHHERFFSNVELESLKDTPSLTEQPSYFKGGSRVLQDQLECPFRAYVRHRLQLSSWPVDDAIHFSFYHGNMVHTLMEKMWERLQQHTNDITCIDAETLHALIDTVVCEHVDYIASTQQTNSFSVQLEQEYYTALIKEWFNLESKRAVTFKVKDLEQQVQLHLSGMDLQLRIDRIDVLNGTQQDQDRSTDICIVDYKTGNLSIKDILPDSLKLVQLPLYVLALRDKGFSVKAACIGHIERNKCQLKGITADPEIKDMYAYPDWETLCEQWETKLSNLATDFIQQKAEVAPLNDNVCYACNFRAMCRIQEQD